jgi:cobalt-zinc-cadmium efflux system membrane fusion protein
VGDAARRTDGHGHQEAREGHAEEGKIAMTPAQVDAAGIQVAAIGAGALVSRVAVPGVLTANQNRMAKVTSRVGGTLAEIRRGIGEFVTQGEVLAVIESREIAEGKSEFLAAMRTSALAEATLTRETRLWRQRISAEQDYLQAQTTAEEQRIRVDLARQKLSALGLSEVEIAELPRQHVSQLRRLEVRAPIAGQITARAAILGGAVASDAELFTVANLSTLWVEASVPPKDLHLARQDQSVAILGDGDTKTDGKIVFLNPLLDPETRSARVVALIDNADGAWRPGTFVTVQLLSSRHDVELMIPKQAVQEIGGELVVFVRTPDGFEKREVAVGRDDADNYEVIFGLESGAEVATGNAFVLKAELSKSEASHNH